MARRMRLLLSKEDQEALARERFEFIHDLGVLVRDRLRAAGIAPLADDSCASPVITTFTPPDGESSADFVTRCLGWGFHIAGHSGYLAERGLVQIATMGASHRDDVERFFDRLERAREKAGLTAAAVG